LTGATEKMPRRKSYAAWTQTYRWETLFDIEYLYAGPLFIHQLPHAFVDW